MRTISWNDDTQKVEMIDQRLLPQDFKINSYNRYQDVAEAIQTMVIRGAPAIGAAAAFGLALAGFQSQASTKEALLQDLREAGEHLKKARPTAVNLAWAVKRMLRAADGFEGPADKLREHLQNLAKEIADEDVEINKRLSEFGAALIEDGDHIVHHCNTGALATVDWGTALGVIRMAHEQGKKIHVFVDETRPRLQGARLTAWELEQYGIPYDIITDGSSGYLMRKGLVQKVIFGADRVAANGDVANKIGSYMLALAAYDNGIPAYSAFPISTVDFELERGDLIPIEEREAAEVLQLQLLGKRVTPESASARNFAFDVTPARLISAWITEKGVIYPPFKVNLKAAMVN
ncbi:MAG TPA: S-methyl-5-thioribose-1-phosphate isomerase [Anaerolineaceae bacterium]|nr:S-methyl-5-thioribose-1-phosphate isomerase [Anaerolineaceae bacterium]